MFFLLDDTSNRGSDVGFGTADDPIRAADQEFFSDEAPEQFQTGQVQDRQALINKAQQNMGRGRSALGSAATKKIGSALGDENMFADDSSEGHGAAHELAEKKARDFASEQIGKKISNEGIKKGFEKGLSKGAKDLAKEGAKKVGKEAAEVAVKTGAKTAAKAGSEVAVGALEGAVDVAGAATGVETFGIGFLVAFLLNIAISLGVSDAVDAGFELAAGNPKQAWFLSVRAAAKVGVFIYLLLCLISLASIAGIFIAAPLLFWINIYGLAGLAFKKIPHLQGLVWWEVAIIIIADIFAFIILMAFIGALGWYLCSQSGLGTGGVSGTIAGAVASVYDWWTKSQAGSVAADFCKYVSNATQ